DVDPLRAAGRVVGLVDADVRAVGQWTLRTEHAHEAREPVWIGGLGGREHPAVDERQIAVLHLSPLPRHALPEAPVVIVIPPSAIEWNGGAIHHQGSVERP